MKQSINLRIKRFIVFCFIYFSVFSPRIFSESEKIPSETEATWTILVIAQTKGYDDLHRFFIQNLKDMARIGSNETLNILVQWEQPQKNGIWRYKVTRGKLELAQNLPLTESDYTKKVVDFVRWGVANYKSKHLALIFSGHGSGIIDPNIQQKPKIEKVTSKKYDTNIKGVLFDFENKTYLNNQQLTETMKQIKNNILGGQKLDIIGMDACLMSGIEMQYQIKDQATIFVGSEEQEYAYGWIFSEIFKELSSHSLTPFELANNIVNTYGLYYQNRINWFTQSAVNLEDIIHLKNNLDQIIIHLHECQKLQGNVIKNTVKNARRKCLQFNIPIYVDLGSFYSELHKGLQEVPSSEQIEKLKKDLTDGIKLIETSVFANTAGKNVTQAKGISIYYPKNSLIDISYLRTKFAQESLWLQFLKDFT